MKVCVIGPNLLDQSQGTFHVHAFGCADTKKSQYRFHQDDASYGVEVASLQELTEFAYPASDFGYEPSEWRDYFTGEFKLFPCVGELPDETSMPTEAERRSAEGSLGFIYPNN